MAARKIQLLSQMGWWSKVNTVAEEFSTQFPNSDQDAEVTAHRVIALRHLGFLALEAKDREAAQEYLKTALSLDPKDAASLNLLQMAGGAKAAKQKTVKTTKKGSSK
jgi:Tfp pilus assembly protein PilF